MKRGMKKRDNTKKEKGKGSEKSKCKRSRGQPPPAPLEKFLTCEIRVSDSIPDNTGSADADKSLSKAIMRWT